jgi:hypothetical protein
MANYRTRAPKGVFIVEAYPIPDEVINPSGIAIDPLSGEAWVTGNTGGVWQTQRFALRAGAVGPPFCQLATQYLRYR